MAKKIKTTGKKIEECEHKYQQVVMRQDDNSVVYAPKIFCINCGKVKDL